MEPATHRHTEAIKIVYDPAKVKYQDLLQVCTPLPAEPCVCHAGVSAAAFESFSAVVQTFIKNHDPSRASGKVNLILNWLHAIPL